MSDGPRTCINLGLSHCVNQHPRLRTAEGLLTPFGTQCPSIVAPGQVLGNPCDPGGYILSPSEITACKYGSCCADMAVISVLSWYRSRISCCILWYAAGFFSRKYVTAAKNVETVSPPAMLLHSCQRGSSVDTNTSDTYTSVDAWAVISSWLTSPVLTCSVMFVKKSSRPELAFNRLPQR